MWRGAREALAVAATPGAQNSPYLKRSFLLALTTQLSNPKAAVVYGSVFAALLPKEISWEASVLLCAIVFVIETGWYTIVALALSASRSRAAYLGYKAAIDRLAGSVMALLGLKLMTSTTSA